MKTHLFGIALFAIGLSASAADVGVSIQVGQPGFYGRIDIGNVPQPPQVIYTKPVIIERVAVVEPAPLYLHVPPGHAKNWHKHCKHYHACDRQVYFVNSNWYNNVYVPHYRDSHGQVHGHEDHGKHGKHDKHDKHDKHEKHDKHNKHDKHDD